MKRGKSYTAEKIIKEAGFKVENIGKLRTRIGGLPIQKADQEIRIPESAETELEVISGEDVKVLTIE